MSNLELIKYIKDQMESFSSTYNLSTGQAFMMWYATEGLELDQETAFEAVSFDGGNDKSIDFFYIDKFYERVLIGQGKFNSKAEYKPKSGEFLELVHSIDWLSNPESLEREGRGDLAEAGRQYKEAIDNGYTIEFNYVYMGLPSKDILDTLKHYNQSEMGKQTTKSASVIHIEILQRIHDEHIDKNTRINEYTLELYSYETTNEKENAAFEEKGPFGKSLVTSVPAIALKNLYQKHGDTLFDRNVRLFLGARKESINARIRDTIKDSRERGNFWAYNNGITFICDRYDYNEDKRNILLNNFSIVNGCQTTVTVANSDDTELADVKILARFISSPKEPIIDSIILYNNSQTPIHPWEIASQDKTQKRLKKDLSNEPNPYFYQTRKGEKRTLKDKERYYMENGKIREIIYDKLAQYLGAFNGFPLVAYNDKATLFTKHREKIFPEDIKAEYAILVWRAGEISEELVRREIIDANKSGKDLNLRILKRGGKLFVLAICSIILTERNGAIFTNRLKREVVTSKKTEERLRAYTELALLWYVQEVKDMMDKEDEIPKLIRNQDFFPRLKEKIITKWKTQSMSRKWVDDALPKI